MRSKKNISKFLLFNTCLDIHLKKIPLDIQGVDLE